MVPRAWARGTVRSSGDGEVGGAAEGGVAVVVQDPDLVLPAREVACREGDGAGCVGRVRPHVGTVKGRDAAMPRTAAISNATDPTTRSPTTGDAVHERVVDGGCACGYR